MTCAHRYCHPVVGAALGHSAVAFPLYLSHLCQGSTVHLCPGQLHHPDSHKMATLSQRLCLYSREERDFLVSFIFSPLSGKKNEKV